MILFSRKVCLSVMKNIIFNFEIVVVVFLQEGLRQEFWRFEFSFLYFTFISESLQ